MGSKEKFTPAGEIVKMLFGRIIADRGEEYAGFFSGWSRIVGEETAFHVRPKDIVNGVLILETDHPGWSQRLSFRKEGILAAIRGEFAPLGIRDIRVVVGKGENPGIRGSAPTEDPALHSVDRGMPTADGAPAEGAPVERDASFTALLDRMKRRARGGGEDRDP